ncbi:MAG: AI-2E family transporter [Gammaproteobacteria bacterium]
MKIINYTASAILVVIGFYLLDVGESLLLPLVIAIVLWYLINTLARAFARLRLGSFSFPMPVCLGASFITFLGVLWAVANFLSASFGEVLTAAPVYQQNLVERLQGLPFVDMAMFTEGNLSQLIDEWIDLPSYARTLASSEAGVLASGGLIIIYIGFLFFEQGYFKKKIAALAKDPQREADVNGIINRIRDDIQKYISIKVFTSTLTGLLSFAFLFIVGIDFAGIWGLLIFLLNFIPTVGSIVATIFPAMIALAQSDGYTLFVLVLAGVGTLQMCIGNILEPRMMGSSFNLSPIVILLNLALWGSVWGVIGMFLCVPFLISFTISLSHFPQTRPIAIMLSSDGDLRVPEDEVETFSFTNPDTILLGSGTENETDDQAQ